MEPAPYRMAGHGSPPYRTAGHGWRWAAAALALAWAPRGGAQVVVEQTQWRMVQPYDPGTVQLLLRNEGAQPTWIEEVRLNGRSLEVLPGDQALWWRMSPGILAPQAEGVLSVCLSPGAGLTKVSVAATTSTGETVGPVTVSRDPQPACYIGAIRFGPGYGQVYLTVRNRSNQEARVQEAQVNGQEWVPGEAEALRVVPPHGLTCLAVTLATALRQGDSAVGQVRLGTGEGLLGQVRAFRAVPVMEWQGRDRRPEMAFDRRCFVFNLPEPQGAGVMPGTMPAEATYVVSEFPTDADAKARVTGSRGPDLIWRIGACRLADPRWRVLVTLGGMDYEIGWLTYAPLADLVAVLPGTFLRAPGLDPASNEPYYDMAREAASPGPWAAIVDAIRLMGVPTPDRRQNERWVTPLEHELDVGYAIGAGAAGHLVWEQADKYGYQANQLLEQAVAQVDRRLQGLKPLLSVAVPCEWASTTQPKVACRALLVADRAVLLVLLNEDLQLKQYPMEGGPTATPHGQFEVKVSLPDWLPLAAATDLDEPAKTLRTQTEEGGGLTVAVDGLEVQRTILLHRADVSAAEVIAGLNDAATAPQ